MAVATAEAKSPTLQKEAIKQESRRIAAQSWDRICISLDPAQTPDFNPNAFLENLGILLDHEGSLNKKDRNRVNKGFKSLRSSEGGKEFIKKGLKEAFIDQINADPSESARKLNLKIAEQLGFLGNRFGIGADIDVSQALGAPRKYKRRMIGAGLAAAVPLTFRAAWKAGDIIEGLNYPDISETPANSSAKPTVAEKRPITASPKASPAIPTAGIAAGIATIPPKPEASPPSKLPSPEAKPAASPIASPSPEPKPSPTPEPPKAPEPPPKENLVEIGSQNLAEFFLGQWILELKGKGNTLWETDPSYKERVPKHNAESDCITTVYLGTDNERDRDRHATTAARSDVIIIERLDPHTFKTIAISINRDLLTVDGLEYGLTRINEITTLPLKGVNPYPLLQKMFETMTGWRIDGIVQTNIDFVNGYDEYYDVVKKEHMPGKNSVIDKWIPEGLEVNPPRVIEDRNYPKGFGVQHVRFNPGPQILHGQDLVKYARARKGDGNDDYERSTRQREVGFLILRTMASKIADDLLEGKTDQLDLAIEVLIEQEEVGNFFQFDIDTIGLLGGIRDGIKEILAKPNGNKIIGKLVANSAGNIANLLGAEASKRTGFPLGDPGSGFTSFGLSSSNGFLEAHPNAAGAAITRLRGSGSNLNRKTAQGNFMAYWQKVREKCEELEAA